MSAVAIAAALLLALAAATLTSPVPQSRLPGRRPSGLADGSPPAAPGVGLAALGLANRPIRGAPLIAVAVTAGAIALAAAAATGSVVAFVIVAAAATGVRAARRRYEARCAATGHAVALVMCDVLGGELRAGQRPRRALALACEEATPKPEAAGAASLTTSLRTLAAVAAGPGDVVAAMKQAARAPGCEGWRRLAACWEVGATAGGGLAPAVRRVAQGMRADDDLRRELEAQLAGPRATARLLALLPVIALLLGSGLGGAPWRVLVESGKGSALLAVGVGLELAGLAWTRRIEQAALPHAFR